MARKKKDIMIVTARPVSLVTGKSLAVHEASVEYTADEVIGELVGDVIVSLKATNAITKDAKGLELFSIILTFS